MAKRNFALRFSGALLLLGASACGDGLEDFAHSDELVTSTTSFQDGVSPTSSYAGTRDTMLEEDAKNTTHGSDTSLSISGDTPGGSDKDDSALLLWDVSAIPTTATVTAATITVTVSDKAAQTYSLYEVRRAWTESQATWNVAATGSPWAIAGAFGTTDAGGTVLGTINASATGTKTITLNAAGIALVQSWVSIPSSNRGLILADSENDNRLEIRSSEYGTKSSRPKLSITWSSAAPPDAGVDSGTPGGSLVHASGHYKQTCDGSGGVAIDATHFMNLNDETQGVRIYTQAANANPVQTVDVSSGIGLSSGDEADLEDAARIGNRVYVISSHGRNKNGVLESMRYRFFALDLAGTTPSLSITVAGSHATLLQEMLVSSNWVTPNASIISLLTSRSQLGTNTVPSLAPKDQGTSIEGLAALPTAGNPNRLVIGFRNPQSGSPAILVTLLNPDAVIAGATAQFGEAFLFDFGGNGVRALAWSTAHGALFIVSGPRDASAGPYALWKWNGVSGTPTKVQDLTGVPANSAPEAIIPYPGTTDLQILYDMGTALISGSECKDVSASSQWYGDVVLPNVP